MESSDNLGKPTTKLVSKTSGDESQPNDQKPVVDSAIDLLMNIVETACEREPDLDLKRLISLMDLYRAYLQVANDSHPDFRAYVQSVSAPSGSVLTQTLGDTQLVSFERFVRDSRLLNIAANAASQQAGESVATPLPLAISANS